MELLDGSVLPKTFSHRASSLFSFGQRLGHILFKACCLDPSCTDGDLDKTR
jgi:hypothetical protein